MKDLNDEKLDFLGWKKHPLLHHYSKIWYKNSLYISLGDAPNSFKLYTTKAQYMSLETGEFENFNETLEDFLVKVMMTRERERILEEITFDNFT